MSDISGPSLYQDVGPTGPTGATGPTGRRGLEVQLERPEQME